MQSGSECCPQGHVALMSPSASLMLVLLLLLLPLPLGGEQLTRSVGKAPTTSSHLLTTSARFCYTKCAEVCSRMRLSIRHVAHQNGFFAVSGISFLSLSPLSISVFASSVQLSVWSSVFYIFWLVVWLFGRLLLTEMHENRKFIAHPLAAPLPPHHQPTEATHYGFEFVGGFRFHRTVLIVLSLKYAAYF